MFWVPRSQFVLMVGFSVLTGKGKTESPVPEEIGTICYSHITQELSIY